MIYMINEKDNYELEILEDKQIKKLKNMRALTFIKMWCKICGSTYEGRKKAICNVLEIKQKPPILVNEVTKDLLFSIRDTSKFPAIWINYRALVSVRRNGKNTVIYFCHHEKRIINVDVRNVKRSILLCEQYLATLPGSNEENTKERLRDIIVSKG